MTTLNEVLTALTPSVSELLIDGVRSALSKTSLERTIGPQVADELARVIRQNNGDTQNIASDLRGRVNSIIDTLGLNLEKIKPKKILVLQRANDGQIEGEDELLEELRSNGHQIQIYDIKSNEVEIGSMIDKADFVLCIFSSGYKQDFDSGEGGHQLEIIQRLYEEGSRNKKFIAVGNRDQVPTTLKAWTSYDLTPNSVGHNGENGFQGLLRRIEERSLVIAAPLPLKGPRWMPPRPSILPDSKKSVIKRDNPNWEVDLESSINEVTSTNNRLLIFLEDQEMRDHALMIKSKVAPDAIITFYHIKDYK